jgi:hypothetical protein
MDSVKYIGMDVHKEAISIAVLNSAGKLVMNSQIGPSLSSQRLFARRPQTYPLAPRAFSDACDVANTRVHTPSNSAGTHFSAGQWLQL